MWRATWPACWPCDLPHSVAGIRRRSAALLCTAAALLASKQWHTRQTPLAGKQGHTPVVCSRPPKRYADGSAGSGGPSIRHTREEVIMCQAFKRREFLQLTLAGTALGIGCTGMCVGGRCSKPHSADQSGLPPIEGQSGAALSGDPGQRLAQPEIGSRRGNANVQGRLRVPQG